jgi:hypothetical protein
LLNYTQADYFPDVWLAKGSAAPPEVVDRAEAVLAACKRVIAAGSFKPTTFLSAAERAAAATARAKKKKKAAVDALRAEVDALRQQRAANDREAQLLRGQNAALLQQLQDGS